ncbi:MAG TPA: hypothetical protein VG028_17900 [Terriglobia bacterium]|nr:hypothetical protein [Terriglobia bacterium]
MGTCRAQALRYDACAHLFVIAAKAGIQPRLHGPRLRLGFPQWRAFACQLAILLREGSHWRALRVACLGEFGDRGVCISNLRAQAVVPRFRLAHA